MSTSVPAGSASPLATKLAERLFATPAAQKLRPEKAKLIDDVILWHERDQREAERQANKRLPQFCENICVLNGRSHGEFFELQLMPAEEDLPFQVQFKRYAVPGRCWVYGFQWQSPSRQGIGSRVVYGSDDRSLPLVKAVAQVAKDLDRPAVVDLFRQAFSQERIVCRYHRDTTSLLDALAPGSKAAKLTERLVKQGFEARKARLVSEGRISATTPIPV